VPCLRRFLLCAVLAFVCSPTPFPARATDSSPATPDAEPPTALDVLAVPDPLLAQLEAQVVALSTSRERRLEALVDLLFGDAGYALEYDGTLTRTVAQSAGDRRANCLSFSLLFVALARRAGIEAYVQETDDMLAWQDADALYGNGHVNVGVKIGLTRKTVDIDRSVVSIRGMPRRISDARALSHFYNNRGAELMREGRLAAARAHLVKSLQLTPEFVPALNNLGVLAMRESDFVQAGRVFNAALRKDAGNAPTLSNMVNL
jgi:tetratricopeptide (TPR) repeat protein